MEIALSYIKIYDKVALIKTVWFLCMNCYITVGPELKVKWRESESVRSLSHVWLLWSPWTVAHQAPLSMGFSRQEYWTGLSCPPPDPGIEPVSPMTPELAGRFSTSSTTWMMLSDKCGLSKSLAKKWKP